MRRLPRWAAWVLLYSWCAWRALLAWWNGLAEAAVRERLLAAMLRARDERTELAIAGDVARLRPSADRPVVAPDDALPPSRVDAVRVERRHARRAAG
jgi:hypothetical protein